jgi:hypothetical protein
LIFQTAAVDLVVNDVKTVEQALRAKIRQTDQLKVGIRFIAIVFPVINDIGRMSDCSINTTNTPFPLSRSTL